MYIEIPLTHGKVTIIEDADCHLVDNGRTWYAVEKSSGKWYAACRLNYKTVFMHRLLLGLSAGDGKKADHIDGNSLNNRRSNLRITDSFGNNRNRNKRTASVYTYKGVCLDKQNNKWSAYIGCAGKKIRLGRFMSEEEAARAYDEAAAKLFGDFAKLNFPDTLARGVIGNTGDFGPPIPGSSPGEPDEIPQLE